MLLFLCDGRATGKRAWQYDHAAPSIFQITSTVPQITQTYCGTLRMNMPLFGDFHFERGTLSWHLGPRSERLVENRNR